MVDYVKQPFLKTYKKKAERGLATATQERKAEEMQAKVAALPSHVED